MAIREVKPQDDLEPVGGFVIVGVLFLVAAVLVTLLTTTGGGILGLGAIISFVRARRAQQRNRTATGR